MGAANGAHSSWVDVTVELVATKLAVAFLVRIIAEQSTSLCSTCLTRRTADEHHSAMIWRRAGSIFRTRPGRAFCHGGIFGLGSVVAATLGPTKKRAQAIATMFAGLTAPHRAGRFIRQGTLHDVSLAEYVL
jgi:hypothetical protein